MQDVYLFSEEGSHGRTRAPPSSASKRARTDSAADDRSEPSSGAADDPPMSTAPADQSFGHHSLVGSAALGFQPADPQPLSLSAESDGAHRPSNITQTPMLSSSHHNPPAAADTQQQQQQQHRDGQGRASQSRHGDAAVRIEAAGEVSIQTDLLHDPARLGRLAALLSSAEDSDDSGGGAAAGAHHDDSEG